MPFFLPVLFGSCSEPEQATAAALPYYADASFTPHWLPADSDSLTNFHRMRPFRLVDQLGDTITEQILSGKVYVADFFSPPARVFARK